MSLRDEILEQPLTLQRIIDRQWSHIVQIAEQIRRREIEYIFLTARGTSDHAGLYAKYLWGAYNRLPIALAAPSLFSIYERPPTLKRALVLGISQSGQSPDIVSVVREGRQQGCPTLAITNDRSSPLAAISDWTIDIEAGPEKAVAATKSYTGQLMAIALLSVALSGDLERLDVLRQVPAWVQSVLAQEDNIARIAERYRYMQQSVIIGRGFNYATAFEFALKLKELTYTVAMPYSSADFRHGPIAIVAQGFPVLAVTPGGAVFPDVLALLTTLKQVHRVELLVISDEEAALELADRGMQLPAGMPEWVTPLVSIVPAQLFCYYLTRAKGFDTEAPRGLHKVTRTQ